MIHGLSIKRPRPIREKMHETTIVAVMKRAGANPAYIYAFRKTGGIVTKENARRLSADGIQEWNGSAIEEYENMSDEDKNGRQS
jgi:hypothetical protein